MNILTALLLLIAILTNSWPPEGRVRFVHVYKPGLSYDLYLPEETKNASDKVLMLVHGMVPEGSQSPLLKLVAENLAGIAHISVMAPDNKGLMASQIGPDEVSEMRLAINEMGKLFPEKRKGIMSFCYANGVVLSALSSERKCPVDFLVLWGSFASLTDATMYSLTGFYQLKGSLLYAEPDSGIRNRYFRQRYLYLPFKPPRRAIVEAAVIKNGPQGLRADEKPVFEFLRNTDYRHFNALFRRLPAQCIAWHNQMSAIQNISTLRIPVIFVHSKRDVLVPYYETVKLYNSYPGPKQVFLLNLLEHVDPLKFGNSFMESIRGIAQYYRFLFALLSI